MSMFVARLAVAFVLGVFAGYISVTREGTPLTWVWLIAAGVSIVLVISVAANFMLTGYVQEISVDDTAVITFVSSYLGTGVVKLIIRNWD